MLIELKKVKYLLNKNKIKYKVFSDEKETCFYIKKNFNKNIKVKYNICISISHFYKKDVFCIEFYSNNFIHLIDYKTYIRFNNFYSHLKNIIKK